jgi:hypothetical protein
MKDGTGLLGPAVLGAEAFLDRLEAAVEDAGGQRCGDIGSDKGHLR